VLAALHIDMVARQDVIQGMNGNELLFSILLSNISFNFVLIIMCQNLYK
jgi:hypothetical protein